LYCPPDELEEDGKEGSEKIKKHHMKLLKQKYYIDTLLSVKVDELTKEKMMEVQRRGGAVT